MTQPAILIRHLHKTYRDGFWVKSEVCAARGVDLCINPGEFWALLGPNGAGKTTIMQCLLGLLYPDAGDIAILGASPALASTRARIGFQAEIFFTYTWLSGPACLRYYGKLSGLSGADLNRRVASALRQVGLDPGTTQPVRGYSKGMLQRLGLAQSLVHDPDILIWDEPTSGLDPEGRRLIWDLLKSLRSQGKTALLSTHVLADVEGVCDHVAILVEGRVRLAGRVTDLIAAHGVDSLEEVYLATMREVRHAG